MDQKKQFFVYSPDGGLVFYETEQEALAAAKDEIGNYKDDGEWSCDVTSVIVGKVSHRAKEANVQKPQGEIDEEGMDEAGDYWNDPDEIRCDYEMTPIAD